MRAGKWCEARPACGGMRARRQVLRERERACVRERGGTEAAARLGAAEVHGCARRRCMAGMPWRAVGCSGWLSIRAAVEFRPWTFRCLFRYSNAPTLRFLQRRMLSHRTKAHTRRPSGHTQSGVISVNARWTHRGHIVRNIHMITSVFITHPHKSYKIMDRGSTTCSRSQKRSHSAVPADPVGCGL